MSREKGPLEKVTTSTKPILFYCFFDVVGFSAVSNDYMY